MTRVHIPKATQTEVLLKSKRRCCICFGLNKDLNVKKGQIAHLDGDSSNPAVDNLAFLCLEYHDEYDSRTSQSKSLTDSELRAYRTQLSEFWEEPQESKPADVSRDVLQQLALLPHRWKNSYMGLYPGKFKEGTFKRQREYSDVWDMFSDVVEHSYSEDEWKRYSSLFLIELPSVIERLEKITLVWSEYLDHDVKHWVLKLSSNLELQVAMYSIVKAIFADNGDVIFTEQFKATLSMLGEFSRQMDAKRAALV